MNIQTQVRIFNQPGNVGGTKVTLKLDRDGRLCVWPGNVQSQIVLDDKKHPYVPNIAAIGRYDGRERYHILTRLETRVSKLLQEGASVVLKREEVGL